MGGSFSHRFWQRLSFREGKAWAIRPRILARIRSGPIAAPIDLCGNDLGLVGLRGGVNSRWDFGTVRVNLRLRTKPPSTPDARMSTFGTVQQTVLFGRQHISSYRLAHGCRPVTDAWNLAFVNGVGLRPMCKATAAYGKLSDKFCGKFLDFHDIFVFPYLLP
jgi:hypothetical protein